MTDLLALNRGHVDLWFVRTEDAKRREWLSRYQSILSDDEQHRRQKFVFEKDRDQFLVAHALLRTTLSRYLPVPPEAWLFPTNEFGKPEIDASQNPAKLRFNISHCDGLVLCGVTLGCDIGVDCENINRKVDIDQLAGRVFSVRERDFFESVNPGLRTDAFFQLWTLKEAYIKARGLGMALPLQEFSFELQAMPRITISFDPGIEDIPESWQFFQPEFAKPFIAAVAVNRPLDEELHFEIHEA